MKQQVEIMNFKKTAVLNLLGFCSLLILCFFFKSEGKNFFAGLAFGGAVTLLNGLLYLLIVAVVLRQKLNFLHRFTVFLAILVKCFNLLWLAYIGIYVLNFHPLAVAAGAFLGLAGILALFIPSSRLSSRACDGMCDR